MIFEEMSEEVITPFLPLISTNSVLSGAALTEVRTFLALDATLK
jgi:hypothetical protein